MVVYYGEDGVAGRALKTYLLKQKFVKNQFIRGSVFTLTEIICYTLFISSLLIPN